MTRQNTITDAIENVLRRRRARGATVENLCQMLRHLKRRWKKCPALQNFLDAKLDALMKTERLDLENGPADQFIIPGAERPSQAERDAHALKTAAARPLTPSKPQKPCTAGLFDDDRRNQIELF